MGKGLPFRTAYKVSGQVVAHCIQTGETLESLPLKVYREYSALIGEDVYEAVDLDHCVSTRSSYGGPCEESVTAQIEYVKACLENF